MELSAGSESIRYSFPAKFEMGFWGKSSLFDPEMSYEKLIQNKKESIFRIFVFFIQYFEVDNLFV